MTTELSTIKTRNLIKRAGQKSLIIQNDHIKKSLNDVEMIIAESGTSIPIRAIEENELISVISNDAKIIARNMGVKHWNDSSIMKHDAISFYSILKKYYSDMTISEIKTSFELAAVGELDEYLPKGKDGKADKNHYQSFSVEYVTKIINAFRLRKNQVWSKVMKALPAQEIIVSDEERKEFRDSFVRMIHDKFNRYKDDDVLPNFIIPTHVLKYFKKAGLINEVPAPSDEDVELAIYRVMSHTSTSTYERPHINSKNSKVISRSASVSANRIIREVFDNLIKTKQEIEKVII